MSEEAVIKVSLDTREAQAGMRGLVREGQRAAGGIGQMATHMGSSIAGFGLARLGAWGAAAAGAFAIGAPLLGSTMRGAGDVSGEMFGGIGAKLNDFIFGKTDDAARASKSAREQTIAAFGAIAGATGQIPPGAKNFYEQIRALRMNEEKGRSMFEESNDFRSGTTAEDFLTRIGKMFEELGQRVVNAINPSTWFD